MLQTTRPSMAGAAVRRSWTILNSKQILNPAALAPSSVRNAHFQFATSTLDPSLGNNSFNIAR